ncbi:MAG: HlyD family secretion protein [Prevotella sp.]
METTNNTNDKAQTTTTAPSNGNDTQNKQAVKEQQTADTQAQQQTTEVADNATAKPKKQRTRQIITSAIGLAILLWALVKIVGIFIDYTSNESSNDAQIEQYISPVNLRASGYIKKIYFTEHQTVKKGDTLLVLDDREYRIRVMEAEAALKDAKAGANVMDATMQTTENTASVYDAGIAEIEVRLAKLSKDITRYRNLVERKAATPIQLEQLETEYAATRKKLEATRRQQKAAVSGVNEVKTRKANAAAAIERAEAALEMARLNLSYTVVVAPCDGQLGRRALEEGQMVNAGQTITYIMPDTRKWVIANYKETQMENIHVGQKVRLTVDALSGKEFEGRVTAISGATGSKYSLVPTDNSAGNFVKIQQRVPVRIDFTGISKEDNARLAAGMMVVVKAEK